MSLDSIQITHGSSNVFNDLGFSSEIAENLKIRADLMLDLREIIQSKAWSTQQAAKTLQESTSTIEDLLEGEIDRFTVDELIKMLSRCGCQVEVQVKLAA